MKLRGLSPDALRRLLSSKALLTTTAAERRPRTLPWVSWLARVALYWDGVKKLGKESLGEGGEKRES